MEVVDRRKGKEHLIPGVSGPDRRSLETHTTSEKTHTTHRVVDFTPTHPCGSAPLTPEGRVICVSTGGLLWAQREAPFLWKCTALMFLHMGKGLNGSHDLSAFAFPPGPLGQSSCQISECMDSRQVLGLDIGGKEHGTPALASRHLSWGLCLQSLWQLLLQSSWQRRHGGGGTPQSVFAVLY